MAKALGVRGAGQSVLQTSELLTFSHTTISRVYRVYRAGVGRLVGHHREATETQINSGYNQGL